MHTYIHTCISYAQVLSILCLKAPKLCFFVRRGGLGSAWKGPGSCGCGGLPGEAGATWGFAEFRVPYLEGSTRASYKTPECLPNNTT